MISKSWQPISGHLLTPWAEHVDPDCSLPEYPRPQLVRQNWVNLNGLWDYAVHPKDQKVVHDFEGQILVPYAIESALSGVKRALLPGERLWYRRTFTNPLPLDQAGPHRALLNFGAVDYECEVWINGIKAGEHRGGYLPFSFDITPFLRRDVENECIVAVWDPSNTGLQQCGKQVLQPNTIWYTAVSGIWQTVWMEVAPDGYISSLKIRPDLDAGEVRVGMKWQSSSSKLVPDRVRVSVYDAGEWVAQAESQVASEEIRLAIPDPKTWSPDSPHLYDLVIEAGEDRVSSYFGMRKFSLEKDVHGHTRFYLNNQPLFIYGPLDQGYFPDGLYTAPSDEALRFDIEYCKKIGLNLIRKHVKVEPARWYYHCDRLGMIVWQDMPNGGKPVNLLLSSMGSTIGLHKRDERNLERFGRSSEVNRLQFKDELQGMIEHLYNFPCIAAWTIFNEGWGQFRAKEIADWVKEFDPTRSVDHASGWFDQGAGDYQSRHIYGIRLKRKRKEKRAFVISEFGGYSLKIDDHVWDAVRKFGYRFYGTPEALTQAYIDLLEKEVKPLIPQGLMAAIYTETTDVEIEINGYLTYDRKVEKMHADKLRKAHKEVLEMLNDGG